MKANMLFPGDNRKSDTRCRICSTLMHYGTGKMTGCLVCTSCGNIIEYVKEAPKSALSANESKPMIIQSKGKKNSDWDDDLPKGAVITAEFDLSEQGY